MVPRRVLLIGLVIVCAALGIVTPQAGAQGESGPRLIAPSGPYAIGRASYQWADPARAEPHTPAADDFRELAVEIWYPAAPPAGAVQDAYLPAPLAEMLSDIYQLPVERVKAITSNAYPGAPLAGEDAFPVVIFSPGFSAYPRQYTVLLEELASHGLIVVATTHPYATSLTVYPDGRTREALAYDELATLWAPQDLYYAEFQDAWMPDVEFVLDRLEALNRDDPGDRFTGRLDLEHVGMLGHSQGGRTISEVCLQDARCDAAVNLDGAYSARVEMSFDRPFLYISADYGVDSFVKQFERGLEALPRDYYVIMIPRTGHTSFDDAPFWLPLVYQGELPAGVEAAQIALLDYRMMILDFFERYLGGAAVTLLEGPLPEHPEVFLLAREEPVTPPTVGAAPRPAHIGDQRGTVPLDGAEVWTFEGQAGQVLDVELVADRPADNATQAQREQYGLLDTMLVIRSPEGVVLDANDDVGQGTNSRLAGLELPAAGTYRIEARSWQSMTAGDYTLLIRLHEE